MSLTTQSIGYSSIKALSNSLMGVYEDDFKTFVSYWIYNNPIPQKKTASLSLGTLVDTLLTNPEEYETKFIIFKGIAPTGQMLTFCNILSTLEQNDQAKQIAYEAVEFKRDKFETVIKKFEKFGDYYQTLLDSKDKSVITIEQSKKAGQIFESLKVDKYVKDIVNIESSDEITVYCQLEIYIDDSIVPLKGALDKVVVNHKHKWIKPLDFKTSYNPEDFKSSYRKYRYFRQASFYNYLVKQWAIANNLGNYKILPFEFIVASTGQDLNLRYTPTSADISAAQIGGYLTSGEYIKGWMEIINEIRELHKTDWEYPFDVISNNGNIPLNIFK